jgi:hypothetical protein
MINIIKFINVPVFIASFLIGLVMVYIYVPQMRRIYVYPTPENVERMQYSDQANACFEYKQEEVECPGDASSIFKIKPQ